jgi:hypothetical protein
MFFIIGQSTKFTTISLLVIFRYGQVLQGYLFMKVRQFTSDASKQASFDVAQVDHDNVMLLDLHGAQEYTYASKFIDVSLASYYIYLFIHLSIYSFIYLFTLI